MPILNRLPKIPTLLRRKEFEFILACLAAITLFIFVCVCAKYGHDLYNLKHNIQETKYTM